MIGAKFRKLPEQSFAGEGLLIILVTRVDVTGAGDTVVAALTLSLCGGASLWEAAVLGNLAASIVVRQFGTVATSQDEMKAFLQALLDENSSD
jgi:bifunctional ADP-heptose synthase (sugar kinase/adenylyltransferase)